MSSPQKPGSKPEKTMSSRLLTMKFMQRAAATAATKEPQLGDDSDSHSPKRQRLSTEAETDSPGAQPAAELETISAAMAAEEDKRREAISRQAAEAGETEWVLDYSDDFGQYAPQPNVVAAGSLDADDEVYGGRKSYGNFRRKKTGATNWTDSDQIDSMIEKEKPKEKKPAKLKNLKSISGGFRASDDDSEKQKKRKRKLK